MAIIRIIENPDIYKPIEKTFSFSISLSSEKRITASFIVNVRMGHNNVTVVVIKSATPYCSVERQDV